MTKLCQYVDVCISNEEGAKDVFGIEAENTDIYAGKLDKEGYKSVARQLADKFGFEKVAITLRESMSASDNDWSGMLYDAASGEYCFSKTYHLHIIDRVGGGDSFGGGLIYALLSGKNTQEAIEFAVAASALKHSVEGDYKWSPFPRWKSSRAETLPAGYSAENTPFMERCRKPRGAYKELRFPDVWQENLKRRWRSRRQQPCGRRARDRGVVPIRQGSPQPWNRPPLRHFSKCLPAPKPCTTCRFPLRAQRGPERPWRSTVRAGALLPEPAGILGIWLRCVRQRERAPRAHGC